MSILSGVGRRLVGGLALLVAVTGCAAIPTAGPVTEVADDSGFGQSTVRYLPAAPTDGASPGEIVRGYLDAMLAYPSSARAAAAFLTPTAATKWQRQDGVTIYSDAQVATSPEDGRTRADARSTSRVSVDAARSGELDAQGRYEASRGRQSVQYWLEQVDGQWRINNPQPGLLVTDKFFVDYFRPFDLYFFDRPAKRLVPQPVHVLVEDGLAAALVTSLAQGDSSDQVRTFVPGLNDLRATVPVDRGVADVGFTAGSRKASDIERLSAQVASTLRQVPGVSGVRISVGDKVVRPNGVEDQPITSGDTYVVGDGKGATHGLVGNKVVEVDGTDITAISGPWGADAGGTASIAVTDDRIALVADDRRSVRIAALAGSVQRTVDGTGFIDPATDVDGQIWLVDRLAGGTRVRLVTAGSSTLDAPSLRDQDVRHLAISPDGSRYVVTVGAGTDASVRLGRVIRDARGVATGLSTARRLDVGDVSPRSATWSDDVRVAYLASTNIGIQVQIALIDGSTTTGASSNSGALLPDVDISRLVIGSGADAQTYVTDPSGRLWYLGPLGTWLRVDGDPIRSLGHSR